MYRKVYFLLFSLRKIINNCCRQLRLPCRGIRLRKKHDCGDPGRKEPGLFRKDHDRREITSGIE